MNEVTCAPQARALLFNKATGNWAGKKKEKRCSDFESTTLINAALYRRLTCTICTIGSKVALRLFNSDISAMELNEDEEESRCWRGFRLDKFLRLKEVIPVHFAC